MFIIRVSEKQCRNVGEKLFARVVERHFLKYADAMGKVPGGKYQCQDTVPEL